MTGDLEGVYTFLTEQRFLDNYWAKSIVYKMLFTQNNFKLLPK